MKMGANSTRILILVHIKKYRGSIDFKDFSCMYISSYLLKKVVSTNMLLVLEY